MPGISDMRFIPDKITVRLGLVFISVLALSSCASLTSLYFYPQSVWVQTPDRFGVAYEDVWFESRDGTRLHAWHLKPETPDSTLPVILYLHGNAENISTHSLSILWMTELGFDVLALDYRGYGASEGRARMPGVLEDVEVAALWWREQNPGRTLAVLGQSMGAAMAVNLAAQPDAVDMLVAESSFAGFPDVARAALGKAGILGWLVYPFTWLVPDDWDPQAQAAKVRVPALLMHSRMDDVIPYKQGREVYEAMPPGACWAESKGPHIGSFRYGDMREHVVEFLRSGACPE